MRKLFLAALISLAGLSAPAAAATLIVDGSGELTGATGVDVNGTLYDVEFVDASCVSAFGGCDSVSDFAFSDYSMAYFAAQALRDQVFIDGPSGDFDSFPASAFGCEELGSCHALIPYDLGEGFFTAIINVNLAGLGLDYIVGPGTNGTSYDYSTNSLGVWARFTPAVSAVPEPSTWAMMLFGFGAVGFSMRRRRREEALTRV